MNRRDFLCASVGAACVMVALPAVAAGTASTLRVALIGCGPRGSALAGTASRATGCRIAATWDADPALARAAAAGHDAVAYPDVSELLNAEQPEVAIIAGRAEPALIRQLLQSGAHLFLEAAPAVSLAEGRSLLTAADASTRVVQVNSGATGLRHCAEASALLRSGRMGRVSTVRAHIHDHHTSVRPVEPGRMLDWAGEILVFNEGKAPRRATATGDARDQVVTWEFDGLTAIWEQRTFTGAAEARRCAGATWYGSGGVLRVDGADWHFNPSAGCEEHGTLSGGDRDAAQWTEFLRAIRERSRPSNSLELAVNALEMVRLAECSRRLERSLDWDGMRGVVFRDAQADHLLRSASEWTA